MKNIVFYGDSLLSRLGKAEITQLEKELPDTYAFNCAVGGYNSSDGVSRAPFIVHLPADLFILSFGMNDCAPWKRVPIESFRKNITAIVEIFSAHTCLFLLPPPVDEVIQPGPDTRKNTDLDAYRAVILELSESMGFLCVDIRNEFAEALHSGRTMHGIDGVHPNEEGNKVIIAKLQETIKAVAVGRSSSF